MAEEERLEEEEQPEPVDEEKGGILSWVIFVEITVLCLLAAYIQISGIKQLPLP